MPSAPVAVLPVLPLTVDQLNAYMGLNSQPPDGRQFVITGTIVPNPATTPCTGSCTGWLLQGSDPTLFVKPVGDIGPGPWDQGGEPLTGTFAATMTEPYRLDYEGPVATGDDGAPSLPSQLPSPADGPAQTGFWLVQGWMGGPSVIPLCPAAQTPYPGPQYGCGELMELSDNVPGEIGGSVRVQNGAYEQFAPSPSRTGSGMMPEQAAYLLQVVSIPPCSPTKDCFVAYEWSIVARVGPWPVAPLP